MKYVYAKIIPLVSKCSKYYKSNNQSYTAVRTSKFVYFLELSCERFHRDALLKNTIQVYKRNIYHKYIFLISGQFGLIYMDVLVISLRIHLMGILMLFDNPLAW